MLNFKAYMKKLILFISIFCLVISSRASQILIPMDEESQANHLKAYGIAYWVLQNDIEVEWLLNFRGGSFLIQNFIILGLLVWVNVQMNPRSSIWSIWKLDHRYKESNSMRPWV